MTTEYIGDVFTRLHNPDCIVEESFAICDLLNMLPLLYHLGNWPSSQELLSCNQVPAIIASLFLNIIHSADCKDGPFDLVQFPELVNAVVHVECVYGENAAALRARPLTV